MLINIIVAIIISSIVIYFMILLLETKFSYQLEIFNAKVNSAKKVYNIFLSYSNEDYNQFYNFINLYIDEIHIEDDTISFKFHFYSINFNSNTTNYDILVQIQEILNNVISYGNELSFLQLSANNTRSKLNEIEELSDNINKIKLKGFKDTLKKVMEK